MDLNTRAIMHPRARTHARFQITLCFTSCVQRKEGYGDVRRLGIYDKVKYHIG